MMIKRLLTIFIFSVTICSSQNQTSKWHFGQGAGLSFLNNPPLVIASSMTTSEGCASLSDAAGNILFYTDGVTVYNQQNQVMANGMGLFGNSSTTQSALILKRPGSSTLYDIFTLGAVGTGSLCFSTVDMSLAAGMGSVTTKNTFIYSSATEKLSAAKHCNGIDSWVVTHEYNSNNFRSFLLTASGITTVPVISSVGSIHSGNGAFTGYLKISPNGKKIGMAIPGVNTFELYDFDPSTGIVSNPLVLINITGTYGCEFSPDGTKFYGTRDFSTLNALYQWDLCAGNNNAIIASQFSVAPSAGIRLEAMQIAPDGKIYISRFMTSNLAVINNPNAAGAACNFVDLGPSISPALCRFGLPNFPSTFFNPPIQIQPFTYSVTSCRSVSFSVSSGPVFTTCTSPNYPTNNVNWNFGDTGSGALNTSTLNGPVHHYTSPGSYTAQLIFNHGCRTDTLRQVINVTAATPVFTLSGKSIICKNESASLSAVASATQGNISYSWSPVVSTASIITVSPSVTTVYTVTGTGQNGCVATQTLQLAVNACTTLKDGDLLNVIRVYPNPTSGDLYFEGPIDSFSYKIYDPLGLLMRSETVENKTNVIHLQDFSCGIYYVELKCGQTIRTLSIFKTD